MRLVPVDDKWRIEAAAGSLTITSWEAIQLAQLMNRFRDQQETLRAERKPYPITTTGVVDVILSLDVHHTTVIVRFVEKQGGETSFNLPEDIAKHMLAGLEKKIEVIEAAKQRPKQ